ncbi:DUF2759 family protein [Aureibacillus halotolerans]|uniref:Uncharacterized protein DUF2759 n=1 Tax=Aureibacillus halotolerans TaxID=1508390 RepID=A0A4R6UF08_9BACI|nr:DUF2759 family protein [Aureibacillus halotolerans]TDQ41684.1 uncharacterized protein DUF2759 [Aureibacillus halotolerans]
MGIIIIFGIVTILGIFGFIREFSRKNFVAVAFSAATVAVFGWFTVNTLISLITNGPTSY